VIRIARTSVPSANSEWKLSNPAKAMSSWNEDQLVKA
jgi:hypothetical protein